VVREHPKGRHHEPAVQRADRERRPRRAAAALVEQLIQALQLPFVVAEDQGGRRAVEEPAEPVQVAVHLLRRKESELDIGGLVAERQPGERADPAPPGFRAFQNRVALGHVLAEAPGDIEVVLRLTPRALHLVPVGAGGLLDDKAVGGQQLEQRHSRRRFA
jgi:hypothetical protein